ncbi:hypothetical protein ACPWR0_08535 [Pandoraea pneumonica]|uniref:hypothetical protein n=1 Tax=Pandoraea pneumonica TaxID=2508299 RepID=UPI003CEA1BAB
MPAVQLYSPLTSSSALANVSGPALVPLPQPIAPISHASVFYGDFDGAANRGEPRDALRGEPAARDIESARSSPQARPVRSPFSGPCRTRYPTQGGFTRQSLSSPKQIDEHEHKSFMRKNGESVVFGELLEMLRPVGQCPNRRYQRNVELRDALWHRMYCHEIFAYASVDGMAITHKIPSLMTDEPAYFPGSVGGVFYDIGFEALRRQRVSTRKLDEMPASDIERAGRFEVRQILLSRPNPRDPYHGFTAYFKPLQFHAHANGMQDAADMLDRITRDDSFGYPVTGPSEAASFLADDASLLDAHLRACERAAEPSRLKRWLRAFADWLPKL